MNDEEIRAVRERVTRADISTDSKERMRLFESICFYDAPNLLAEIDRLKDTNAFLAEKILVDEKTIEASVETIKHYKERAEEAENNSDLFRSLEVQSKLATKTLNEREDWRRAWQHARQKVGDLLIVINRLKAEIKKLNLEKAMHEWDGTLRELANGADDE